MTTTLEKMDDIHNAMDEAYKNKKLKNCNLIYKKFSDKFSLSEYQMDILISDDYFLWMDENHDCSEYVYGSFSAICEYAWSIAYNRSDADILDFIDKMDAIKNVDNPMSIHFNKTKNKGWNKNNHSFTMKVRSINNY